MKQVNSDLHISLLFHNHVIFLFLGVCPYHGVMLLHSKTISDLLFNIGTFCCDGTFVAPLMQNIRLRGSESLLVVEYSLTGKSMFTYNIQPGFQQPYSTDKSSHLKAFTRCCQRYCHTSSTCVIPPRYFWLLFFYNFEHYQLKEIIFILCVVGCNTNGKRSYMIFAAIKPLTQCIIEEGTFVTKASIRLDFLDRSEILDRCDSEKMALGTLRRALVLPSISEAIVLEISYTHATRKQTDFCATSYESEYMTTIETGYDIINISGREEQYILYKDCHILNIKSGLRVIFNFTNIMGPSAVQFNISALTALPGDEFDVITNIKAFRQDLEIYHIVQGKSVFRYNMEHNTSVEIHIQNYIALNVSFQYFLHCTQVHLIHVSNKNDMVCHKQDTPSTAGYIMCLEYIDLDSQLQTSKVSPFIRMYNTSSWKQLNTITAHVEYHRQILYGPVSISYHEARETCRKYGGQLLSISKLSIILGKRYKDSLD